MSDERVMEFSFYARVPADQEEMLSDKINEAIEQILCPEDSRTTHGEEHVCRWPWTFGGSSRPYDPKHEEWIVSVEEEVDAAAAVIWRRRRKERGLPDRVPPLSTRTLKPENEEFPPGTMGRTDGLTDDMGG